VTWLGDADVARHAKDLELVLHIGLHKTATTYVQNVLSARRYDLIQDGLLYPNTGTFEDPRVRTRQGAQSGHTQFTRQGRKALLEDLLNEVPATTQTVLLSAEDFTLPRVTPEQHLEALGVFGSIKVVVVVRRQDAWIESVYKQAVDQYGRFETRSFGDYLAQEGPSLLDFHARLSPWRQMVGPESFHVLSYDDLPDGAAICRRVLEIAGLPESQLDGLTGVEVPRYDSVRAIDVLGLRILNGYRLKTRDVRNKVAQEIYAAAPAGDLELMTPEMRAGIQARYAPINERIESEWFSEPVPGFRFGTEIVREAPQPPSGSELIDYMDHVIAMCEAARGSESEDVAQ
jgi:hypothetical protein